MKHAYVSLVLPGLTIPSEHDINRIDQALSRSSRNHEIVIVVPHLQKTPSKLQLTTSGPVCLIKTHIRTNQDGRIFAGLARTVGDFVIEWCGPIEDVNEKLISSILKPSGVGVELLEVIGIEKSMLSRNFYWLANAFRSKGLPLTKTIGRVYSRRAVQSLLGAHLFEPQLNILVAELPVERNRFSVPILNPHNSSFLQRLKDGSSILIKGTKFGSIVPLMFAAGSALFGLTAVLYSIGIFWIRGQAPQGWTTLMIVIGLGQSAILTMLGLVWTRIDALNKGLSRPVDTTAEVQVWAPNLKIGTEPDAPEN